MNETAKAQTPIKAAWVLVLIAWILFLVPFPGLGIIGWVVNFAAFIMAIVVLIVVFALLLPVFKLGSVAR